MARRILVTVRGCLFRNIGLKLVSLLCAVSFWIYVTVSNSKIGYFPSNLPVEVKNIPTGLTAIYDEQKVRVKLQAPLNVWSQLSSDNLTAYIDLAGLDEGIHEADIKVRVDLPDVTVVEKEPSTLMIGLETIVQKEVPVKVVFEGQAKKGFVPSEPIVKPDKVKVQGAKSLIEEISHVEARVKLTGQHRDFQKRVPVAVYDERGEKQTKIKLSPKSVELLVNIFPVSGIKTVGIKVKTKGRPKPEYYVSKIECSPAVVEIFSTAGTLPSILNLETEEIDIQGLEANLETEKRLSVPANISLKEKTVRVKVTLAPNTVERQISATHHYKLSPGFRVISIDPVQVVVSGPANIINHLSPDKVIVTFDFTVKEPDSHLVDITKEMVSVPKDCLAISWLPTAVTADLGKYE